jgi:hypothetical protein
MTTGSGKTQLALSLLGDETWQVVDPILGASKRVNVLKVSDGWQLALSLLGDET